MSEAHWVDFALWTDTEVLTESWAESDQMSFWTPLHQAVFNHAPVDVVRRLIDAGAFRKHIPSHVELDSSDLLGQEWSEFELKSTLVQITCSLAHS